MPSTTPRFVRWHRKRRATQVDLQRTHETITQEINQCLSRLDSADQNESGEDANRSAVQAALSRLQQRQGELNDEIKRMEGSRSTLSVQGEPEAQVMKSLDSAPGYNLQTTVDAYSHLIVHHRVCNDTSDIGQLAPMAQGAAQALEAVPTVVADAGYANSEHLQSLASVGQIAYVATLEKENNQGKGEYYRLTEFTYDRERDCYVCLANELLTRKQAMRKDKCVVYAAPAERCDTCALKPKCTGARKRFVRRLDNTDALEANARRVAKHPEMMKLRRRAAEHPFATIKHEILRNSRLLMRGLKGVTGELSLTVLAYNLKRLTNRNGTDWALTAVRA